MNSDMLCMACQKKLDDGSISEADVRLARAVKTLASTFKVLDNITIKKVLEGSTIIVMLCCRGDRPKLVGREGVVINRLSKMMGKTVRVIEETEDMKEFIKNIIHPVPLEGINVVYSTDGENLKVIIPRNRNLPMSELSFREIIKMVFGRNAVVAKA
ncbi:MAG: hypothetical protein NTU57_03580 [Candidatus Aenigmarchaeota archaeon]|nr:hypothetical protein [Candidatus Aenigmarchaeota archaeon]